MGRNERGICVPSAVEEEAHAAAPHVPPRHGSRSGFVWGDKSWTWREIDAQVSALSAALAARGVVKGDRILVHSKNGDEMFFSMFAAFRLGAVWVPTNFRCPMRSSISRRLPVRRDFCAMAIFPSTPVQ